MFFNDSLRHIYIRKKTVAILGCGGLGCNIMTHLAGEGIGKILLCDFDVINESNLNRQFLYCPEDIGKAKCEVAAERLVKYAPALSVLPINKKIEEEKDLSFASEADLIILAVDNNRTRKIANDYCERSKKALVCGGINGFYGLAYLFLPGKTKNLIEAGLTGAEAVGKSISSTAGIIGSIEAELALRYLSEDKTVPAGKLLVYDNMQLTALPLGAAEK